MKIIKRLLTASLVFVFLAPAVIVPAVLATWAPISLEELLKQADVIVIARLTDVKETTKRGTDYGSGDADCDGGDSWRHQERRQAEAGVVQRQSIDLSKGGARSERGQDMDMAVGDFHQWHSQSQPPESCA
jgi:hypothetical protein